MKKKTKKLKKGKNLKIKEKKKTKNRDTGNINDDRNTQREITDWDTGTQITTGRYKWRPGHSKINYRPGHRDTNDDRDTGNINDERDAQREITDWDTGTQMTTGILGI